MCAAASIREVQHGRRIFGVVYDIPDELVDRNSAKYSGNRSLDAIEGEGTNYVRIHINVFHVHGLSDTMATYVAKHDDRDKQTSYEYACHILSGIEEHNIPDEYRNYVISCILKSNPTLSGKF